MFEQIVTRCGLLCLLVFGACFSPEFEDGKIQCGADDSCPPGLACYGGVCRAEDPGIDANTLEDAPPDVADAPIDAPPADVTLTIALGGTGGGKINATDLSCTATECTGTYAPGTTVALSQTANAGSMFAGWGGACASSGSGDTCSLTLDADTTASANWNLETHQLTVTMNGNGVGMITSQPTGISCSQNGATTTGTCTLVADHGAPITLTAGNAGAGSVFLGWSLPGCESSGNTCTFMLDADTTVSAPFGLSKTLVIGGTGNGSGTVSSTSDAFTTCAIAAGATSGSCTHTYATATTVTLEAAQNSDSVFAGWSGGCSGMTNTCTVSVDMAVQVTARFDKKKFTLTLLKANNGADTGKGNVTSTQLSCGPTCNTASTMVDIGTMVTFAQSPATGSAFDGWTASPATGTCTGGNCTVTVNGDMTVTASYTLVKQTVTASTVPVNGLKGTVSSNPAGITNCPTGGSCTAMFNYGQSVTLTANAVNGYTLLGWDAGPCSGSTNPVCTFMIGTQAITATARFTEAPYDLTIQPTGTGVGTVIGPSLNCMTGPTGVCTTELHYLDPVQLTATADAQSDFVGWTGAPGCTNQNPCTFTLTGTTTVQAAFKKKQFVVALTKQTMGIASGTVTSSAGGINCGSGCASTMSTPLDIDSMVTLTATPSAPSSVFAGWGGDCATSTGTTCTLTMDQAKSVTAKFDVATYNVTVDATGGGYGTVTGAVGGVQVINCVEGAGDCSENVAFNKVVMLSATATASPAAKTSGFQGWTGAPGCTSGSTCNVTVGGAITVMAQFELKPNIAFVTSTTYTISDITSTANADMLCQARAQAAALPGTYVAWLSSSTSTAASRLTGSGWVRPDAKPFARSKADLVATKLFYPLRFTEGNADVQTAYVWTGTKADGTADAATCSDWTTSSASGRLGVSSMAASWWTANATSGCNGANRLYCLGNDRVAPVSAPAFPAQYRTAFITGGTFMAASGIGTADQLCATEATNAGLSGTYKALLATSTASPISRFDTNGAPWVRVDGAQLAPTANSLLSALYLDAGLNVTANGTYIGPFGVWTGSTSLTTKGTSTSTCGDWSSTTGAGISGTSGATEVADAFGASSTAGCGSSFKVYCLQQ
jgi:hypothetical protein